MLLLNVDETSRTPQYRQILDQIRSSIEEETLRPGDALPSTRGLAGQLGIHRSTVATAYQELWALGLVDLHPGARPRVRRRPPLLTAARRASNGLLEWENVASAAANDLAAASAALQGRQSKSRGRVIDFSSLEIDWRLFPLDHFRSCVASVLRRHGTELLRYGDHAGFLPLREHLARRLRAHGIATDASEILLTNGSQHAIDLVLRMIAAPGRSVAVESPTYNYFLPLLRFNGLEAVEIPLGSAGMDLAALAAAIRERRPSLVYTMPNFQNPTSLSTTQAHREQLLALCEENRIPLLEDGFEEEMKYFGKVVLPIKSMDKHHVVIYCGTLSKVLFPGVRIGWVVADQGCIERLAAVRRFSELSPNMVLQASMEAFYEAGYYDRHVSRMHRVFRRRMQTAMRALRTHVPSTLAEWNEPAGGFLLWLKLASAGMENVERHLAARGVVVNHGERYFVTQPGERYLRLSISSLDDDQIIEGVRRLSTALHDACAHAKN